MTAPNEMQQVCSRLEGLPRSGPDFILDRFSVFLGAA